MNSIEGSCSLRRWPWSVYPQVCSRSPLQKEMAYFFRQYHNFPPYTLTHTHSLISQHTLECQTHPRPPDPYQQSSPLCSPNLSSKCYLFILRLGKYAFPPPPLHVRIGRHDNLNRWTANVTWANQPIASVLAGQRGSLMGFTAVTLGPSRCAHMNENESAGLSGVA